MKHNGEALKKKSTYFIDEQEFTLSDVDEISYDDNLAKITGNLSFHHTKYFTIS